MATPGQLQKASIKCQGDVLQQVVLSGIPNFLVLSCESQGKKKKKKSFVLCSLFLSILFLFYFSLSFPTRNVLLLNDLRRELQFPSGLSFFIPIRGGKNTTSKLEKLGVSNYSRVVCNTRTVNSCALLSSRAL